MIWIEIRTRSNTSGKRRSNIEAAGQDRDKERVADDESGVHASRVPSPDINNDIVVFGGELVDLGPDSAALQADRRITWLAKLSAAKFGEGYGGLLLVAVDHKDVTAGRSCELGDRAQGKVGFAKRKGNSRGLPRDSRCGAKNPKDEGTVAF